MPIWTKWFSPSLYLYWFRFLTFLVALCWTFKCLLPTTFAIILLHSLNYPFGYHVTSWVNTNILPWNRNSVWLYQKIFQAMFCPWMVQIFLCFSNFNRHMNHLESCSSIDPDSVDLGQSFLATRAGVGFEILHFLQVWGGGDTALNSKGLALTLICQE